MMVGTVVDLVSSQLTVQNVLVLAILQVTFLKNGTKSHQKRRTNDLRMGALLGVISDIHRVHTNPEDPMDVRNDHQQYTNPQAVSSSNFLV